MNDEELSAGVIAYLQKGAAASPRADEEACAGVASTRDPATLVAEVTTLVRESLAIPIDWSSTSLGDAGRQVAAEMGRRHPGLSAEARDALAWNFTFTWR